MQIINSKWLRMLSVALIVWGIFLCLESLLVLFTGMINEIGKQAQSYRLTKEESILISRIVRRHSSIQLFTAFLVITGGFGLCFRKKWAWFLVFFLSIAASIYVSYRVYRDICCFRYNTIWYLVFELAIFVGIMIILIRSKHPGK